MAVDDLRRADSRRHVAEADDRRAGVRQADGDDVRARPALELMLDPAGVASRLKAAHEQLARCDLVARLRGLRAPLPVAYRRHVAATAAAAEPAATRAAAAALVSPTAYSVGGVARVRGSSGLRRRRLRRRGAVAPRRILQDVALVPADPFAVPIEGERAGHLAGGEAAEERVRNE